VNVVGTLILFQATYPLLAASPHPKFIPVSSGAGSLDLTARVPLQVTAYGASKAAENYLARKIHFEHPELGASLLTFSLRPIRN
jgi:NAD(P)-dependent dehydrogenase (short-subunit alcohol dehydrogenase family)